jgi:hypothetical protein
MMEQIEARKASRPSQQSSSDKPASCSTSRTGSPTPGFLSHSVASEVSGGQSSQGEQMSAPVLPPYSTLGEDVSVHDYLLEFFSKFCEYFQIDAGERVKTARFLGLITTFPPDSSGPREQYNLLRYAYGNADGPSLMRHITNVLYDMQAKQQSAIPGDSSTGP